MSRNEFLRFASSTLEGRQSYVVRLVDSASPDPSTYFERAEVEKVLAVLFQQGATAELQGLTMAFFAGYDNAKRERGWYPSLKAACIHFMGSFVVSMLECGVTNFMVHVAPNSTTKGAFLNDVAAKLVQARAAITENSEGCGRQAAALACEVLKLFQFSKKGAVGYFACVLAKAVSTPSVARVVFEEGWQAQSANEKYVVDRLTPQHLTVAEQMTKVVLARELHNMQPQRANQLAWLYELLDAFGESCAVRRQAYVRAVTHRLDMYTFSDPVSLKRINPTY